MKPSDVILRFFASVEAHPEKIAIADESVSLTFGELRDRVIVFGNHLSKLRNGVDKNLVQAILVDRTIESLVAVLSCIYAGIPFSSIDGETPRERMLSLLSRLNSNGLLISVPKYKSLKLEAPYFLVSTTDTPQVENRAVEPGSVDLESVAQVVFTSGSTGTAKGVMINWRGLAERFFQSRNYSPEEIASLRLAVTQPTFFASGLGRQLSTCLGISVFLLDPTKITQTKLLERVRDLEITNFSAPPSIIRSLGQIPAKSEIFLPSVRIIETGAEGIRYEDLAAVARFFPKDVKVRHGLGATEGSSTIRGIFTLKDAPMSGQVPLGVQAESDQMKLLPPADPENPAQEILAGTRLAMGYFNDPKLTAERFIFDENGRRWWRSGDLVVRDEQGVFWHRGRIDDLVKVRGKLTSPSEATHVLMAVPGIRGVIVLPHTIGGAVRLVAHIVVTEGAPLTAREVRRALATSLPSHLNPALIMKHKELPLGNRGKIDRRKLQENPVVPWRDEPIVEPLTASEFFVVNEAMIVLDLDELSITDDLWEYGMDSLSAIELISRLESSAVRKLTIDDLLRSRTPEQIAARLESTFIPHFDNLLFNEGGTRQPLFAIPGAGGHASHYVHLARALGSDQPLLVFPEVSIKQKDLSIEADALRISTHISETQSQGRVFVAGYSGGGLLALEVARKLVEKKFEPHLLLIDAGGGRFNSLNAKTRVVEKASGSKNPLTILWRKIRGASALAQRFGWRRARVEIWFAIRHKYLGLSYLTILYWITGGKYPRGSLFSIGLLEENIHEASHDMNFYLAVKLKRASTIRLSPVNCNRDLFCY